MSCRLIGALAGLIAAVALTGMAYAGASATKAGTQTSLVTMPPQSNLKLLSHATLIGAHARGATLKLTISLKLRHVARLKAYLDQGHYQPMRPLEFRRLYGPTEAQVTQVEGFLETHHIRVLNVSPDRTLIHTEATTGIYERTLDIQINDYKLDGRRFYSTADRPKLPPALASLILGILGLNHGLTMSPLRHKAAASPTAARPMSPRTIPPAFKRQ